MNSSEAPRRVRFDPSQNTGPVPSPCISVCRMDEATGWCEGCLRTLDEVAAWGRGSEDWKRSVWAALKDREAFVQDSSSGGPGL